MYVSSRAASISVAMSASLRLDRLELADRLAERLPLLRVLQRLVQRSLGESDAHRRDADASAVEDLQELAEAPAARAEQVRCRNTAAVEAQRPGIRCVPAHLAIRLGLLVARRAVLDDEVGDLVVARARGDRHVSRDVGAGVGDELLRAVDDPAVGVERRARLDVAGVGAGVGLGQPERAELAPGAQVGQQPRLLLVVAEEVDRLRAERGVGAHRDRDRAVDPRELLDGDRVLQRAAAGAADLLRERDAPSSRARPSAPRARRGRPWCDRARPRPARSRRRRTRGPCAAVSCVSSSRSNSMH